MNSGLSVGGERVLDDFGGGLAVLRLGHLGVQAKGGELAALQLSEAPRSVPGGLVTSSIASTG